MNLSNLVPQHFSGDLIDRAERFIHEYNLRFHCQRACDPNPLSHSTGQLFGVHVFIAGQPDHSEVISSLTPAFLFRDFLHF
jgi:hypothetical protein